MADQPDLTRYKNVYGQLLRLYPKNYRDRYGESMLQTFMDLCQSRAEAGKSLFGFVLWIFGETSLQILRQYLALGGLHYKHFARPILATSAILLIPAIGMQFSDEVHWTASDFLIAAVMLMGSGLALELLLSRSRDFAYRLGSALAVFTGLFLLWANLAVGIIGSQRNPANLMYHSVLAIAISTSLLARFRPIGMACAMSVTALAQTFIPVIAFAIWPDSPREILKVFMLNPIFVTLFLTSTLLFLLSSRPQGELRTAI